MKGSSFFFTILLKFVTMSDNIIIRYRQNVKYRTSLQIK